MSGELPVKVGRSAYQSTFRMMCERLCKRSVVMSDKGHSVRVVVLELSRDETQLGLWRSARDKMVGSGGDGTQDDRGVVLPVSKDVYIPLIKRNCPALCHSCSSPSQSSLPPSPCPRASSHPAQVSVTFAPPPPLPPRLLTNTYTTMKVLHIQLFSKSAEANSAVPLVHASDLSSFSFYQKGR